jgi:hypothetical protein
MFWGVKHSVVREWQICPSFLLLPFPSSLLFHFLPMKFGRFRGEFVTLPTKEVNRSDIGMVGMVGYGL